MTKKERSEEVSDIKEEIGRFKTDFNSVTEEIGKVIVGNKVIVEQILMAFFSKGHVLLEGVPGLGKTLLVKSLSKALGFDFKRIQFTPDLMPADITGTQIVVESGDGRKEFEFRPGPLFTNILLADEINRATPKTQSAMLEAMEERQVTVAGKTHGLREPFFVMATQNPIEHEGTYPLPEAQVDRFMLKIRVPYPDRDEEREILRRVVSEDLPPVAAVATPEEILTARSLLPDIRVDPRVEEYILDLVRATREASVHDKELASWIDVGASPRATIFLGRAARAQAFIDGRPYVIPEDVRDLALDVLRHRVLMTFEAEAEEITPDQVIERLLEVVPIP